MSPAGRAAFILGQCPFRTGLLKVGLPGAKQGIQDSDPTIAEMLKPLGYATAQIGKNHLGDPGKWGKTRGVTQRVSPPWRSPKW